MSANSDAEFIVVGRFADDASARAAAGAVRAAGMADRQVELGDVDVLRASASGRGEVRFVWRLLWVVVLWSIVGGVVGGALGVVVVWAGIGAGGRLAVALQIIGWVIFGHLIAGMWAGYALLADRSKSEFTPDGGYDVGAASVVRVRCRNREEIERARELLDASGAIGIEVMADAREAAVKKP